MPSAERQRTQGRGHIIAVTPDQIERRGFAIEERGYDRDEVRKFLFEVAATVRLAQRSTMPPIHMPMPATDTNEPAGDPSVDFETLSAEVSRILRAAEITAAERHEHAETLAEAIIEQAERDAEDIRRRAELEALGRTDKAHQVLVVAQQQAAALVAEAEERATTMVDAARDHARQHARQIARAAQHRAAEVASTETETLHRLNQARLEIIAAMDALSGPVPDDDVVDLTDDVPEVAPPAPDPAFDQAVNEDHGLLVMAPSALRREDAAFMPVGANGGSADQFLVERAVSRAADAARAQALLDHDPALRADRPTPVRPSVTRRVAKTGAAPTGAARPSPAADLPQPVAAAAGAPSPTTRRASASVPEG